MSVVNPDERQVLAAMKETGRSYPEISRLAANFDRVLDDHPSLSSFGMGLSRTFGATAEEQRVEFDRYRQELRNALPTVALVYYWLQAEIGMIRTPTRGSYGLKHVAEKAVNHSVANGEFIAAALMAGYSMREQRGPNPLFGVRKRDVDAAIAAIERSGGKVV